MPAYPLPDDFIFGTATASYQVEGAYDEDGRSFSIWDQMARVPGKVYQAHNGDVACDHYHRVDEDIELMKNLGIGAYRFSIAWPRIIPDGEGDVNPKGIDWYSKLVDKLLAAGITPYATMYHWDLPQIMEDKHGGWRSRRTPEAFARYASAIVEALGDRVKNWMPLNEMPCVIYLGHKIGKHAPGAQESVKVLNQIQHHCLMAHGYGVRAVREFCSGGEVGDVHNASMVVPVYETDEHIAAAMQAFKDRNGPMLGAMAFGEYPDQWLKKMGDDAPVVEDGDMQLISEKTDFMGFNYYSATYTRASDDGEFEYIDLPPSYPKAYAEWIGLVPQGLYWGLRYMKEIYGHDKLYVTENGCAMDDQLIDGKVDDLDRVQFYRTYLQAMHRAVSEGYPVKGYFAWSLLDNFEWAEGYRHRFGLHYVDYETQERIRKLSGEYYAACVKAKAVL